MRIKNTNRLRVLLLEPYYGGSHKIFLHELKRHLLSFEFVFLTLPARKWKWRMRMAAPWAALQLPCERHVDLILCSTFIDVACLRGLGPGWLQDVPILTYFHENQFAYPVQKNDPRDFHFGLNNYLSALASDGLAFNSQYNLAGFLKGCQGIEKRAPDMDIDSREQIRRKSRVLYPGMDFSILDNLAAVPAQDVTTFVWNHRWEHDKNPEGFFKPFFRLQEKNIPFKLIILGQSFQRNPDIFAEARIRLASHIRHYGYVEDRSSYLALLKEADVIISTAYHEFYGMSVIEAVRAGCRPLLPKRLSYPELFPAKYLYKSDADLYQHLRYFCLHRNGLLADGESAALTDQFSWTQLTTRYEEWLREYV
jgi:glycosyltransferase involved in cell wall biosynthesis